MGSSLFSWALRQLFAPSRGCLHQTSTSRRMLALHPTQRRNYAFGRRREEKDKETGWQQRIDAFPKDMSKQMREYPTITARELRHRSHRPRRVKMLARDFIEDSLYNPNYGYFSKHATIFKPGAPFDFAQLKDEIEFNQVVGKSYTDFEDDLDFQELDETRQLWHTPTELFQPFYGEAIARYLVTNYRLTLFPYHDLIIYEMGAGNGTLMRNILDYIAATDPEVYARTKFRVIEISPMLAKLQLQNLQQTHTETQTPTPPPPTHLPHVEIINRSIFDWTEYTHAPCFFLALEVLDNFAHDSIRHDPLTAQPLQGGVLIDDAGEFFEYYERNLDPIARRYLDLRTAASRSGFRTPVSGPAVLRKLKHALPFAPNLTQTEWLPTRMMQFFDILTSYFPAHRLVAADFSSLPQTIPGINAPLVQTRYQRQNVPVTTPFVHQGYFDIFFPTDFKVMEDVYRAVTGKLTRVLSHKDFLERWAYVDETRTRNGENPMLSWYQNAKVMTTV